MRRPDMRTVCLLLLLITCAIALKGAFSLSPQQTAAPKLLIGATVAGSEKPWQVRRIPNSHYVQGYIPDNAISSWYVRQSGMLAPVYVTLIRSSDRRFLHDTAICDSTQGWQTRNLGKVTIQNAWGKHVDVIRQVHYRDKERLVSLHWFSQGSWHETMQETGYLSWLGAYFSQRLLGNIEPWVYVQIDMPVTSSQTVSDLSYSPLLDLAKVSRY